MNPTQIHYDIANWAIAGNRLTNLGQALWFYNPYSVTCRNNFPSAVGYFVLRVGDRCFYNPAPSYMPTRDRAAPFTQEGTMASAFTLTDLSLHYSEKHLLEHVTLTVSRGIKIGIVGRNGAGKSTPAAAVGRHGGAGPGRGFPQARADRGLSAPNPGP